MVDKRYLISCPNCGMQESFYPQKVYACFRHVDATYMLKQAILLLMPPDSDFEFMFDAADMPRMMSFLYNQFYIDTSDGVLETFYVKRLDVSRERFIFRVYHVCHSEDDHVAPSHTSELIERTGADLAKPLYEVTGFRNSTAIPLVPIVDVSGLTKKNYPGKNLHRFRGARTHIAASHNMLVPSGLYHLIENPLNGRKVAIFLGLDCHPRKLSERVWMSTALSSAAQARFEEIVRLNESDFSVEF